MPVSTRQYSQIPGGFPNDSVCISPKRPPIMRIDRWRERALAALPDPFGMELREHPATAPLPGSYRGEPEAGLEGNRLHISAQAPVHSALHEACHFVCMDPARRARPHTDAGGDDLEESAVCFLQILLADELPGVGRERLMDDMDTWRYSFRLGSTRAWSYRDAEDARDWLLAARPDRPGPAPQADDPSGLSHDLSTADPPTDAAGERVHAAPRASAPASATTRTDKGPRHHEIRDPGDSCGLQP
jgi:hypothetical protein